MFNDELLELEKLSDDMTCEGYCDDKPPHTLCKACRAAEALNYIGDIIRSGLDDLEK